MALMNQTISPTEHDSRIARASGRKLAAIPGSRRKNIRLRIESHGGKSQQVELPPGAYGALVKLLAEMSKGNAVALTPIHAQLTTQQAAELLGVSRPFIVKQLTAKKIPYRLVGTHRRILLKDLLAYGRRTLAAQHGALDELAKQAQELNLGY